MLNWKTNHQVKLELNQIHAGDPDYPVGLAAMFGSIAPPQLAAEGDPAVLRGDKLALFCSTRCPGA